jgi:hypothetical protein
MLVMMGVTAMRAIRIAVMHRLDIFIGRSRCQAVRTGVVMPVRCTVGVSMSMDSGLMVMITMVQQPGC